MCKQIGTGIKFGETPLSKNFWGEGEDPILPSTIGKITIHRSGYWDFQCQLGNKQIYVFALYKNGIPYNYKKYLRSFG